MAFHGWVNSGTSPQSSPASFQCSLLWLQSAVSSPSKWLLCLLTVASCERMPSSWRISRRENWELSAFAWPPMSGDVIRNVTSRIAVIGTATLLLMSPHMLLWWPRFPEQGSCSSFDFGVFHELGVKKKKHGRHKGDVLSSSHPNKV